MADSPIQPTPPTGEGTPAASANQPAGASPPKPETPAKPKITKEDVAKLLPDGNQDVASSMSAEGVISLPYESFIDRLNRAQSSQLKKLFGTDKVADILKLKTEYEAMKKERDAAEEARMSEIDREKKATAKAREELAVWQGRYNKLERQTTAAEAGAMIKGLASKHINMAYSKHVLRDLAEDLTSNYTEKQLSQFTDKHLEQWFRKYVQKNPVYALTPVQPANATPAPVAAKPAPGKPTVKVGVTTGPKTAKPTPPGAGASVPSVIGGKEVRPGRENSMSAVEFAKLKKSMGITV